MKKKLLLFPFFLVLLLISVNIVYAPDGQDIDLTNFPTALADRFNITVYAGGILASIILFTASFLPVALFSKSLQLPLAIGLLCFGFCIAVGWLDIFFMLIWVLLVALLAGYNFRKWIGG